MQAMRDALSSPPSPHPDSPRSRGPREHSPGPSSDPPNSPSPTPTRLATQSRKRGSEDLSQFARTIGRQLKLRKIDQDQLDKVSSFSAAEHRVWSAANMLKIFEHQEAQVAPEMVFKLSKSLKDRIESRTISMMLDYTLPSYIDPDTPSNSCGPAAALAKVLRNNPGWGFTPAMVEDLGKLDVLMTDIRHRFTKRRSSIKGLIEASFASVKNGNKAMNIVELSQSILKLSKSGTVKLTIHHCVRFAFIRRMLAGDHTNKLFWKTVDHELEETRKLTSKKQTKFLKQLLQDDLKIYGDSPDINALGSPTDAPPRQESLTPVGDEDGEGEEDDE